MSFKLDGRAGMSSLSRSKRRLIPTLTFRLIACFLLALASAGAGRAQAPATVAVADTLFAPGGSPATGTLTVTSAITMTTNDGYVVPAGTKTVAIIGPTGQFSVSLAPNIGAAPMGTYYYADYVTSTSRYRETWVVPQSSTTLRLTDVRVVWNNIPVPNVQIPASQFKPPVNFFNNCVMRWTVLGWYCSTDNLGSVSLDLELPTPADTGKFQWKPKNALTITRLSCDTDQGSVDLNLELRTEASPNSSGTAMLSTPLTCGPNTTASTLTFAVSVVPSSTPVALSIVSVSGSPLIVRIHTDYQLN